jgi:RNA polymerase sigma factor (sigma-70 family)
MLHASFTWPPADVLSRLVERARSGLSSDLDALLVALRPPLLAFFQRRQPSDVAEDLTQLALIRISGAVDRIDPQRADSYLSTVARNLLRTAYKVTARDKGRDGASDPADLPTRTSPADSAVEYEDLVRAIHHACVTKLAPGLRDVAVRLLDGDSPADVASALHISPVTVRTRMMRVRRVLRTELVAYVDTSGEQMAKHG